MSADLSVVPRQHATEGPTRWQELRRDARWNIQSAWEWLADRTFGRVPLVLMRESTYRRQVRNAYIIGRDGAYVRPSRTVETRSHVRLVGDYGSGS